MKKTLSMLVMVTLLLGFATVLPTTAQTNKLLELYIGDTTAYVNTAPVKLDSPPVIQNSRTLVPVRFISEQMGAKVTWNDVKRQVTIAQGTKTIILTINSNKVLVNGKTVTIDVPAKIINSRTMVPVRFVSEQLGYKVKWDPVSYRVLVSNFDTAMPVNKNVKGTITVWHGWGLGTAEADALDKIIAEFQKAYPNVVVNQVPVDFNNLQNKFLTAAPQGQGPDIVIGPHDWIGQFAKAGLIDPIDISTLVLRANYLTTSVEGVSYAGKVYGLPESVKSDALFYNKDFVKTLPTSINDLLNAHQKYPVAGGSPLVFDAGNFYHESWLHFGMGGGVFNGTNYKDVSPIKNAGAVKAFQALVDMKNKGVMPSSLPDYGTSMSLFTNKKAAFFITGPWEYANLKKALGDKMGVMVIPGGKPFVTIESTMLSKYAKNKPAALEFMKFFTGATVGQSNFDAAAYLGKQIGHVPAAVNAYSDTAVANDPIIKVFSAQAAKGVPIPNAPEMQAVWSVVNQILPTVYQGKLSPQEAANQAYQQITEQISK